ncbi:gephyrin-like molybdotransferase Glp [Salipiger mucosus]|uniref:Molybdopterin molybdenumtransferase n=1 Tax=Salipiger mucosus DSM 16094 TaxID=1123237 RepID=S9QEZ6_9RHOB|nr:gephyrin-like molybdotransferase Glp [Salipiger mucosus]EPX78123.1 Molybdopterin biosynthesis protein MoeA [Salipiger mucosus DSM 16094]
MIPVSEALDKLFALAQPLGSEEIPLLEANGRVLARDVVARRDQPPFSASAMDGYALGGDVDSFRVIGESAAGQRFDGTVAQGEAVRIFTGAPVPEGADRVALQENVIRDGEAVTLSEPVAPNANIRALGNDFRAGDRVEAPRRLSPEDLALLASMNIDRVPVARRPRVALIATGDELRMPGEDPGPDQIIASNTFGLHALLADLGAEPRLLPIARDTPESLRCVLGLVDDADLVITVGGASVGDHDIVARVAGEMGLERAFHRVAMRPGKPLMSGRLGPAMMIGLPGNPVSAMVCGHVFVAPVIRAMLGLGAAPAPREALRLAAPVGANGPREHYMRGRIGSEGVTIFDRQDSSLLSVLGAADALVVRPPGDPAREAGESVNVIHLTQR